MLILGNRRWSNQPPVGAQINFGHPLAKGLTFYTLFNAGAGVQKALLPLNLPEQTVGTVPSPQWVSGPDGAVSHNWTTAWSGFYERGVWVEPTTQVSAVIRLRRTGTVSSFSSPLDKTYQNNTNPFTSYGFNYNPGNSNQDSFRTITATGGIANGGTVIVLPAGSTLNAHTVGLSYISGSQKAYFNGIQKANDNFTGTLTYDQTNTGRLIISGQSSAAASTGWIGQIYYAAIWNRVLTPAEMEWLHVEPYAMLQPKKKIFYSFAPITRVYAYYVVLERLS